MTKAGERLIAAANEARASLSQLVKDETEKRFGMSAEEKKEDGRRQGSRFRIREGNPDG